MRPIDPHAVLAVHVPKWETMTPDELREHIRYAVDPAHKKECRKACQMLRPYVPPPMPQRRRPVVRRGKPVVAPATPTPAPTRKAKAAARPKKAAKKTKTTGGSD